MNESAQTSSTIGEQKLDADQPSPSVPISAPAIPPSTATAPISKDSDVHPTGIAELDKILHGGFPSGATVLMAGASGNGKTILALQWLFGGKTAPRSKI